ncbi:transcriptional regulator with XRE-family HTH domain [Luteibacter sp. 3190]|nr:transcriptional regulator with XRE-family HTH domain [Luteibacter sp. 3190]
MPASKSIDQPEYQLVLDLIRAVRVEAGLSQQSLTERLGRPQTYASDCELGARRMDALQLHQWCVACGTTLATFANRLEAALAADDDERPEKPPRRAARKRSSSNL